MHPDDDRPRLAYRGSVGSRARQLFFRTGAILAGGVALASAFVLSLALFAVALAAVVVGGGYLWWKTRDFRRQLREQTQHRMQSRPQADVIEGVVISRGDAEQRRRDR